MENAQNQDNDAVIVAEHPLKNQVILQQIFQFLQSSARFVDWKRIRRVCKLWHSETLSIWRNTAVIKLLREEPPIMEPKSTNIISASIYLFELQNPESPYKLREIPYRNYKLEDRKIDLRHCRKNTLANMFWRNAGPQMKHLILSDVNLDTGKNESPTEFLQFLIDMTSNLERLEMDYVRIHGHDVKWPCDYNAEQVHPKLISLDCSRFWGFRLSNFPNLQELCLSNCDTMALLLVVSPNEEALGDNSPFENKSVRRLDLMQTSIGYCPMISRRTHDVKFTNLEHLSLNVNFKDDYLYKEHEPRFLPTFLGNHCATLRILEIYTTCSRPASPVCPFGRVQFPMLSELRLWGNAVGNLSFLWNMPNLKLLHMDLYNFEKQFKTLPELHERYYAAKRMFPISYDIVKMTQERGNLAEEGVLEKLEYFQVNCPLSPESFSTLAEWMPNLKTLKAVLNVFTFPVVCKNWPNLEKLDCLFGSYILDGNVTGELGKDLSTETLVDLKNLTRFSYFTECNTSRLTDDSIYQGFLKMQELTYLKICVSPLVSKKAEKALRAQIQSVHICRNYNANPNHNGNWICCQYKAHSNFLFNQKHVGGNEERSVNSDNEEDSSNNDDSEANFSSNESD